MTPINEQTVAEIDSLVNMLIVETDDVELQTHLRVLMRAINQFENNLTNDFLDKSTVHAEQVLVAVRDYDDLLDVLENTELGAIALELYYTLQVYAAFVNRTIETAETNEAVSSLNDQYQDALEQSEADTIERDWNNMAIEISADKISAETAALIQDANMQGKLLQVRDENDAELERLLHELDEAIEVYENKKCEEENAAMIMAELSASDYDYDEWNVVSVDDDTAEPSFSGSFDVLDEEDFDYDFQNDEDEVELAPPPSPQLSRHSLFASKTPRVKYNIEDFLEQRPSPVPARG